jgi:release factor glutamine methyltransferase
VPADPFTVLEILQRTARYLGDKGVEDPRLCAEQMLASLLQCRRIDLYVRHDRPLTAAETDTFRAWVRRRGEGEPQQYITGQAAFGELELVVKKPVFIPRPETELVVTYACSLVPPDKPAWVLDIGCGSGAVALHVLHTLPQARAVAVDINPEALALSAHNSRKYKMSARLHLVRMDLFQGLHPGSRFNLIISNPPYIAHGDLAGLPAVVRDWESPLALDGGPDGLSIYRKILTEGRHYLATEGNMVMEIGYNQAEDITRLAQETGWHLVQIKKDYQDWPRLAHLRAA